MSIESKEDMIKGKTNQAVGKVSGNDKQELKGKAQEAISKTKEQVDETVDKVAKKINQKTN
ncbi:hypothetical protein [Companilactobacillus pabuli]|jgi:uncharacterized protein YjbJ (UPF0337 family)|uniref:CsbD family protein n=1 Tax=Companilactobacillus pabuli TaxID=2714036 RepID=A0A7L7KVC0_9LACO|nr:hypothetical protein [Companilactobacillus pabuli]AKP04183.1 hypothetical protein ABB45_11475 [Companilactobacillus farciminis]AKS52489.1 hypothetical protein ABB44_11495 [Companilactobacillus farciminis]MDG5113519.1 CsbD family protein [Companilactobacillus pabuli]QMT83747.1 CsbD family protein [Companilactobacillus pabuli]GAQ01741.1 hypothetical protein NBRC111452_1555 [Companilactobacillus farciminis]